MRKWLMLLCSLMLCFSAAQAEKVLVEPELDASALRKVPDTAFQSLNDWSYWEAYTYADYYTDTEELTEAVLQFSCTKAIMDQYVTMLQENGFELVSYNPKAYLCDYEWCLRFAGVSRLPALDTTLEGKPYHLKIKGYKNNKYFLEYTTELEMCDLGLRMDGGDSGLYRYGESAGAGLYRLPDGSFQTTDGRLTAHTGEAMVIRDGRANIGQASYASDKSEWLYVTGYHRNEDFFYAVPANYAMQGDVYTFNDFIKNDSLQPDEYDSARTIMNRARGREPYFLLTFDGERYQPRVHENNRYECVLVRTMYYKRGDAAVYYVYARMSRTEPREIEALCAVSLK